MNIGIVGCGNISETYFECQKIFNNFKIVACADINNEAASNAASKYNVKSLSVEEIVESKEIDLIINLTIPSAHKEIITKSLHNGKHCFSEKPLAMNFEEGLEIQKLADEKGLYVGCAPDTFLGAAGQKARKLIEDNKIGKIVLGTFNLMSHGMEHWHPNPDFFFKPGAGPIFDVGVYYITQLVNLLGPVQNIASISGTATDERIITSKPRNGEKIKVETPTTLLGVLNFVNNVKIQFFASWDVWNHKHTKIELYGLNGSIILPDPNYFGGNILISEKDSEWKNICVDQLILGKPNAFEGDKKIANYRGIGLSDMINSINFDKYPRCSLEFSLHVLEIMEGILYSSENSTTYKMTTTCERPRYLNDAEIKNLIT